EIIIDISKRNLYHIEKGKFVQKVIDVLNLNKIPYNIIIIQNEIYIFPRLHDNLLSSNKIAFFEILGLIYFNDNEEFKKFDINDYFKTINEIWYEEKVYLSLNEN